jgi:hypothetical protein
MMKNKFQEIENYFGKMIPKGVYNDDGKLSDAIFSDSEKQDILDMIKDGKTNSQIIDEIKNWGIIPINMGDLYEDSFYRPMICLKNDDGDLTGTSMFDGKEYMDREIDCVPITKEESDILINQWKLGEKEVLIHKGFSETEADEFIKVWRK